MGNHRQGAPVRASGAAAGELNASNAHEEFFVTRFPKNRWCPKNSVTPRTCPLTAALRAPVTFAVASDSISPSGNCEPVRMTGLPNSVSA